MHKILCRTLVGTPSLCRSCPALSSQRKDERRSVFPMIWGYHIPGIGRPVVNARVESRLCRVDQRTKSGSSIKTGKRSVLYQMECGYHVVKCTKFPKSNFIPKYFPGIREVVSKKNRLVGVTPKRDNLSAKIFVKPKDPP